MFKQPGSDIMLPSWPPITELYRLSRLHARSSHLTGGSEWRPRPPPADTAERQIWSRSTWWRWSEAGVEMFAQQVSKCAPSNKTERFGVGWMEKREWDVEGKAASGTVGFSCSFIGDCLGWLNSTFHFLHKLTKFNIFNTVKALFIYLFYIF